MLPVVEVPMIARVLAHLASHRVSDAVLSMGYRPDAFIGRYPDGRVDDVPVAYAVEPEPRGTAGAIGFAARTAGIVDTFVVVNGDVLTDLDLGSLMDFHASTGAEATIALIAVEDPSSFGVVRTDGDGRVLEFVEKPSDDAAGDMVNAGMYVLEPSVLDFVPSDRPVSIEREVFPRLVERGSLYALASSTYWIDAGTPDRYLQAQLDLLGGGRGDPAPGARRDHPGWWVMGSPKIEGEITGPALVGDGAVIGAGARVEGSVIGARAVVAPGAQVLRSVVMADSEVGAGAVVEDSILGQGALVGAGAHLGGLTVIGGGAEVEPNGRLVGVRLPAAAGRG